jgi:hypothetical protein
MPKRLDPKESKPFQPIKAAFLRDVLDDGPNSTRDEPRRPKVAVAVAPEPTRVTPDPEAAEEVRAPSRRVVTLPVVEEEAPPSPAPARRGRQAIVTAGGEKLNRPLKVQLQSSERTELTRITNELSMALGTSLSVSHVTRALLMVFRHAEKDVFDRARQRGALKRPANDDLTAIAVFEHELAKLLLGALRTAKPLRE